MSGWSKEWPKTPGLYWGHGYFLSAKRGGREMKMLLVEAWQGRDHIACVSGGAFIYESESDDVMWMPAELPKEPIR